MSNMIKTAATKKRSHGSQVLDEKGALISKGSTTKSVEILAVKKARRKGNAG